MPEFNPQADYYEILQVHPKADGAVIRGAYRAILKELQAHPDLGGTHDQAVLVNEAYRVLSNAQLREEYDRARQYLLRPVHNQGSKQPRRTEDGWIEMACPACGRPNRMPAGLSKNKLYCGACRSRLFTQNDEEPVNGVDWRAQVDNRLRLSANLFEELKLRGEIELRTSKVPRGGKITCRRCRRLWVAPSQQATPAECPNCHTPDWSAFRLFKCRLCGHEFTTFSLRRNPYALFSYCPSCGRAKWHAGLESSTLNNIIRLFKSPTR